MGQLLPLQKPLAFYFYIDPLHTTTATETESIHLAQWHNTLDLTDR